MKNLKTLMFVLLALMLMFTMVLGACSKPTTEPPPPTTSPTTTPATVAKTTTAPAGPSGTLTVALSTFFNDTFLPWRGGGICETYQSLINEGLVYYDPESGDYVPGLATKWEMSPDAKTFTFWLREGIQFQKGWGELTAEDVVYTVQRIIAPDSKHGGGGNLRNILVDITAPETYKVVITLNTPYPDFPQAYFVNEELGIVSKKYVEDVGDDAAEADPIGTGAYTLIDRKIGVSMKFEAAEGKHWRVSPSYKYIDILVVPEEATRVAKLRTGEVDLAPISYDSVDSVKSAGLNIISRDASWVPAIKFSSLVMSNPERYNLDNPWTDVKVRQALNYAVNKDEIIESLFKGAAKSVGASLPLAEWADIPPYPYDPDEAVRLLRDAGYDDGELKITMKTCTTSSGAELPLIGQTVAMYWEAVGVKVTIVPTDWSTVNSELTSNMLLNYTYTHRAMPMSSAYNNLSINYGSNSFYCCMGSEEIDSKLAGIAAELDLSKRGALIKELGQYIRDQAPLVYIAWAGEAYGASDRVGYWPIGRQYPVNLDCITP